MTTLLRQKAEICNSKGLHARAAARFCKSAEQFESEILVKRGDTEVSGRSIMGLMMLAAAQGTSIEISVSGDDAVAAMTALCTLVANKFDEE
ncbi:MAG: HPr family phosphocarrier protein [Alphaproteobacteria bacterium]|jgi:phosphocarrier protein HPr|nr:HPr family phosphocarrier protein [Alphaproteobacteria bacterium]PHX98767.1 MAG: HPr family phosphocarrier protein [Rhodospirillaceae bacterium]